MEIFSSAVKIRTNDGSEFVIDPDFIDSRRNYFDKILPDSTQSEVTLGEISGDTMSMILSFIRNGTLNLNSDNVIDLLEAASNFTFDDMFKLISIALPTVIGLQNCIGIYNVALKFNHLKIAKLCHLSIRTHLEQVLQRSEIDTLDFKDFGRFVAEACVKADTEEIVWSAIVRWIGRDTKKRLKRALSLLSCIRLENCDPDYVEAMLRHPYVFRNKYCAGILSESIQEPEHVVDVDHFVNAVRKISESMPCESFLRPQLFCTAAYFQKEQLLLKIGLSMIADEFRTRVTIGKRQGFTTYFLISSQHFVYMYQKDTEWFLSFNLLNCQWQYLESPPLQKDAGHTFVTVNSKIYVVWVYGYRQTLRVASYDSLSGNWFEGNSTVIKGSTSISRILAASLRGLIYTACVVDTAVDYNIAYGNVYDPVNNSWDQLEMPKSHRAPCSLVACGRDLIVLEGKVWSLRIMDPDEGIWRFSEMFPCPYAYPKAVILNDKFIIHERYDIKSYSYPIFWDTENNKWSDASSFFKPPILYCAITDKDVLQKYYIGLLKEAWQNMVNEWMESCE